MDQKGPTLDGNGVMSTCSKTGPEMGSDKDNSIKQLLQLTIFNFSFGNIIHNIRYTSSCLQLLLLCKLESWIMTHGLLKPSFHQFNLLVHIWPFNKTKFDEGVCRTGHVDSSLKDPLWSSRWNRSSEGVFQTWRIFEDCPSSGPRFFIRSRPRPRIYFEIPV